MNNKTFSQQRFEKVADVLSKYQIKSVLELGCGDGKFIPYAESVKTVTQVAVIDKDEKKINKIKRLYSNIDSCCISFLEYHKEFENFESIVAIEVIEHLENTELTKFIEIVFTKLKPKLIVFTTPNIEYNIHYPILYNGFRHKTHVFEFSPKQLKDWGNKITKKFEYYEVSTGFCDNVGSSQIIVFKRRLSK